MNLNNLTLTASKSILTRHATAEATAPISTIINHHGPSTRSTIPSFGSLVVSLMFTFYIVLRWVYIFELKHNIADFYSKSDLNILISDGNDFIVTANEICSYTGTGSGSGSNILMLAPPPTLAATNFIFFYQDSSFQTMVDQITTFSKCISNPTKNPQFIQYLISEIPRSFFLEEEVLTDHDPESDKYKSPEASVGAQSSFISTLLPTANFARPLSFLFIGNEIINDSVTNVNRKIMKQSDKIKQKMIEIEGIQRDVQNDISILWGKISHLLKISSEHTLYTITWMTSAITYLSYSYLSICI